MRSQSYLKGYLTLLLVFLTPVLFAQVSSFPYVYDFENFTTIQNTGSCTTTGMSVDDWTQVSTDDGDWLADTNGTASIGTGPGSTVTTSGVGDGYDYNPGTAGGHYLYTEATSCPGSEIILLSPEFDLSDSSVYYRFTLAVHMFGTGMGSLHIDVYSDGNWNNDEWSHSGSLDSVWRQIDVDLAAFRDTAVQVRIRAVTGASFTSDIAIDDARVAAFTPPTYDAVLVDFDFYPKEYSIIAASQADSVQFIARVRNKGIQTISGTEVNVTNGAYSSTVNLGSIDPYEYKTDSTSNGFLPTNPGSYQFTFTTTINENDSFSNNNSGTLSVEFSDSVMARDPGEFNVGIGYNAGTGFQGQWFELQQTDTITSASVNLGENLGDSARIYLFAYDSLPQNMIAQTQSFVIDSVRKWYTARFNCEQILGPGKYFVAVEQRTPDSNIGLGGANEGFRPNVSYYSGAGTPGSWTPIENAGFDVTYLIRLNLGKTIFPELSVTTPTSTICENTLVNLRVSGANTYRWSPSAPFQNATYANAFASFDSSMYVYVTGTNSCGFTANDSAYLVVEKGPTATVSNDTTVCVGESVTLSGQTNNSYYWVNGPANNDLTVTVLSDSIFFMVVDSNNGCKKSFAVEVDASEVELEAFGDTSLCSGNPVVLSTAGADSVKWDGGPWSTSYQIVADTPSFYYATAYDEFGCTARDSVFVEALNSPNLVVTPDTGICFRDSLYLSASGADSIVWIDGPVGNVYPIKVLKPFSYEVRAYNTNGCFVYDTVDVAVYSPPFAVIDDDTTVCEGSDFQVSASGGDLYDWNTGQSGSSITTKLYQSAYLKVVVSSFEGCTDEDSLFVTVDPLPTANFSTFTEEDSVQLTNTSVDADSYAWDFGDGNNSTDASPYHLYTADGDYTITLTATNNCGSHDTSFLVTIEIPTGNIAEGDWVQQMKLYPNPSETSLHVDLSSTVMGKTVIQIADAKGKVIEQSETAKYSPDLHWSTDVSTYSTGVYILSIQINGNTLYRRFMVH